MNLISGNTLLMLANMEVDMVSILSPEFVYTNSAHTDIRNRWRDAGWIPPSESVQRKEDDFVLGLLNELSKYDPKAAHQYFDELIKRDPLITVQYFHEQRNDHV